jgi:hypothetical protein
VVVEQGLVTEWIFVDGLEGAVTVLVREAAMMSEERQCALHGLPEDGEGRELGVEEGRGAKGEVAEDDADLIASLLPPKQQLLD